jgi:hypothetical protein
MQRLLRWSFSPRRVLVAALALALGVGLGLGAVAVWAHSGAEAAPAIRAQAAQVPDPATEPTAPEEAAVPAEEPAPAPEPEVAPATPSASAEAPAAPQLTIKQVKAIALKHAPRGRVVEVDDDVEATGLRYDVTILHANRTSTDVEVDATTGEVTEIDHDDDWD